MQVTRQQVLAHRVVAQGLLRSATSIDELSILDLGVQEAMGHPAAAALDARLAEAPQSEAFGPDQPLAYVWSLRGAPHVHRRDDLDTLTGALYPLSEADAAGRLNETGPSITRSGIPALEQFSLATAAMRAEVTKPTAKGSVSSGVTQRLPEVMGRDCRGCQARHVSDSAMRATALAAGLELAPGTSPPVLQRRKGAALVGEPDRSALRVLIDAYLNLLGPATPVDVAGFLGARRADLGQSWPADAVEVSVEGRQAWISAAAAEELQAAEPVEVVRLLGGFDPYLQARDRDLVVPDPALQKALWPVLGRPGAVLVDGEVVGTWRPKTSGKKLTLTVEAFVPLAAHTWAEIETEAQRMATVRGAASVTVART
jgi:hypothetical protein